METENPTPSNEGASITDRLERYLNQGDAQDAPEQTQAEPVAQAAGQDPAEGASQETSVKPEGDGIEQDAGPQITTTDLAKLLGIDETALDLDEDGSVKLKTKVDGQEGAAKLADLLKSYQLQEHVDRKSRAAAEQEKALQARQQELEQQAQAKLQQVEQLGNLAAQELMREYQSINWEALRAQDPGQYAALKADFQERNAKLQSVFQMSAQEAQRRQAEMESKRVEFVQQQAQRLPEVIPEWKDQAVAAKEREEIRSWATQAGFEAKELDNFVLAHHVAVMRKAMLFDKLQSQKPAVENKVRLAPKLVKPGTPQPAATQQTKVQQAALAVKKSGGKGSSVAEYLKARGIV